MQTGILDVDIERDMEAILKLIYDYMDKTYIGDLEAHVDRYRKQYEQNRSKEAELLKALVPFVPENKQTVVESLANMIRYEHILRKAVPSAIGIRNDMDAGGNNKEMLLNKLVVKIILYRLLLNIENR